MGELEAGFAKLQGEDFEYYMQTYSIVLGRNSNTSTVYVDLDLASLGGGKNISRQHARIFYDFDRKRFALEVLGKNGCYVEGVLYLPGTSPIKLDSQDLLQIGDKKFYFLLPTKKISKPAPAPAPAPLPTVTKKRGSGSARAVLASGKNGVAEEPRARKETKRSRTSDGPGGERERKSSSSRWHTLQEGDSIAVPASNMVPYSYASYPDHSEDYRRRGESGSGLSYTQADEREVVASIASVLSDLCGPGEWMPMARLYTEAPEHYSNVGSSAKVRRVLEAENEAHGDMDRKGRPWAGLLALLRRYPEHFIINVKVKGRISAEYVSLVSLVS
ncbi:hypothetical protein O6H91_Y542800 [Diphasiastrum complanatum]|nr:hypothetical protein O6H91_Y542800 [Diphasiastrum complanatum]